jgi:multimeric flavodoxin WrbA
LKGSPAAGQDPLSNRAAAAVTAALKAKNWHIRAFALAGMHIQPCRGCFSCWVKTPGVCVIRGDDQEQVLRAWAEADLIAMLTPITFGGYAPELKKSLDRIIPVLLPFFIRLRGEIHHSQRYPRRRRLLVVGTLNQEDADSESNFRRLIGRNALNLGDSETTTVVFSGDASLADMENRLLAEPLFREEVR